MIEFTFTGSVIVQLTAAAAMATFAALVAALGRWRGGPLAFGIFAVGFALDGLASALFDAQSAWVQGNPSEGEFWYPYLAQRLLAVLGPVVSIVGVVLLTSAHGVRAWGRPWIPWFVLSAVTVWSWLVGPLSLMWVFGVSMGDSIDLLRSVMHEAGVAYFIVDQLNHPVGGLLEPVMALGSAFLAARYVQRPDRNLAILGVGLLVLPAVQMTSPWGLMLRAPGADLATDLAVLSGAIVRGLFALIAIGAWIWANHMTSRRAALAVAGTGGAFCIIGMVEHFYVGFGASGLARFFDIGLVGYAILRYQYLGLDVKLRWAVSKTTVAAGFVAVFFVASEAAQQFFGDRFNNAYIGIAAAGLLVMAISPLQRIGNRLAAKAVPLSSEAAMEAYRHAVMAALRDDAGIGPLEEMHLAELAQRLEIGAADALRIRQDALALRQ